MPLVPTHYVQKQGVGHHGSGCHASNAANTHVAAPLHRHAKSSCKASALQERIRLQTLTEPSRAALARTRARKKEPSTTISTNSDLQQRVRPWLQPLRAARPRTAQLPAPTSRLRSSASLRNCARSAHPRLGLRVHGAALPRDFEHRPVAAPTSRLRSSASLRNCALRATEVRA